MPFLVGLAEHRVAWKDRLENDEKAFRRDPPNSY
jgi:hypothetical protein